MGEKHDYELEESNPFIVRDLNKCIVCGKCIRACAELTGKDILDFAYRGFDTKVTPFGDTPYIESDCVFCGSCVAVCPTGALTEKQMQRQGPPLGDRAGQDDLPLLRHRLQLRPLRQGRQSHRCDFQSGQPSQRPYSLRQGTVWLGLHQQRQAPENTADQKGR